jgi:hypothetical protein
VDEFHGDEESYQRSPLQEMPANGSLHIIVDIKGKLTISGLGSLIIVNGGDKA